MKRLNAKRIFQVAAIVFPLLIFLFVTSFDLLLPGYDAVSQYVSVLGSHVSPYRILVNVLGFGLFGVVMIGLGYQFTEALKNNYYTKTAIRLFMGSGVLLILLGIFPTDPDYVHITFEGRVHSLIGKILFTMLPVSIIWFGLAFRREEEWGTIWTAISIVMAALGLLTTVALGLTQSFAGLVERFGMGVDLLWIFLAALNLFLEDQRVRIDKVIGQAYNNHRY